ncbi:hypothetical protein PAAG_11054 [Paracoccidioides lutzii Pb01]|uniref:Uncharacterized protein n=1 Tax=Paracoccidioides lutzii (strain ATCC MYA-826 / Pb01) TaxID=502779 RepID=A0A0A2V7P8_PARBA|nr:hypothetical protein PAAG_11054 [Paracoccidioides lutzii Pb01]KGQ02105.1 hypothetical protein PAAG_11054 [Paracoccidioides lutzii Pb01]
MVNYSRESLAASALWDIWEKKIPLTGPTHDFHVWALLDFLPTERVQESITSSTGIHSCSLQLKRRSYIDNFKTTRLITLVSPVPGGARLIAGYVSSKDSEICKDNHAENMLREEKGAVVQRNIPTADERFDPRDFGQNLDFRMPKADENFETAGFEQHAAMQH